MAQAKLLGYERETGKFAELHYPENYTGWDYEIHFSMLGSSGNGFHGEHYVYCRDFNDLAAVLNVLRPILLSESAKTHYKYIGKGEQQAKEEKQQAPRTDFVKEAYNRVNGSSGLPGWADEQTERTRNR